MLNNTLTSLAPYPMRRAAPRHPHTLCHKLCHQDKRKNPSTLYGKLRKTGIVNYDENKSGAEIRDARLLSRLLTEDVEILLNEGATAYKKDGRTRTKLTKRNRGQQKKSPKATAFSSSMPLSNRPPPLFSTAPNKTLIESLSEFYDPMLVTTMEAERREQMIHMSQEIQSRKVSFARNGLMLNSYISTCMALSMLTPPPSPPLTSLSSLSPSSFNTETKPPRIFFRFEVNSISLSVLSRKEKSEPKSSFTMPNMLGSSPRTC